MAPTSPKEGEREVCLRGRIASRFAASAAAISLNHQLGPPSRALVDCVV